LAAATEDHPLEYLDFEGIIPQGQYGGGTVMVWDIGTYEIIEGNYYKGSLHLFLEGKKLKGEWMLRRRDGKNWTLAKAGLGMKAPARKRENASALSGRTMEEIAEAHDATWQSNRVPAELANLPATEAKFIAPMRAKAVPKLPESTNWEYEIKLDGYRSLALKRSGEVLLLSRNGNRLNDRFPSIAAAFETMPDDTVIDGEIVAFDEDGRPSFSILQNYQTTSRPLVYYAFDLLVCRGRSLLGVPLETRREVLQGHALQGLGDPVRFSGTLNAGATELARAAAAQGMEGIVAKRRDSVYEPGQRSGAWAKYKTNQGQELVIGGYMPGKHVFDSLLVGYYDGDRLMFVGKIKNGFVPAVKEDLAKRFRRIESDTCPFANLPEPKNARRGLALTAEGMKQCVWLKPKLVAQIEYADWTKTDHLRHARFAGLREDKDPRDVVKEQAG
jgi:bifunctional non-homologous end joining protein LigD